MRLKAPIRWVANIDREIFTMEAQMDDVIPETQHDREGEPREGTPVPVDAVGNIATAAKEAVRSPTVSALSDETNDRKFAKSPRKHQFSPTPSQVLRYFLIWLRGFHRDREKSKAADWAMVVLTLSTLVAAIVSAVYLRGQLIETQKTTKAALAQVEEARRSADATLAQVQEARKNTDAATHDFKVDERAWVEIEIAKHPPISNSAVILFDIVPKNVGKTVARGVSLRVDYFLRTSGERLEKKIRQFDQNLLQGKGSKVVVEQDIAPNANAAVPYGPAIDVGDPVGDAGYCLLGLLTYRDEFNVSHYRLFCFVGSKNLTNQPCEVGNEEDGNEE
jgi:hypothetical protein